MIKVIITDDHRILREGLKGLLGTDPDITVVGEASNGEELLALMNNVDPDVVLLDIGMPVMNGLVATKKIKEQFPYVKVLILTQYDSEEYLYTVLHAGASGYVLKETASTELIWAIKTVNDGLAYLSPAMTQTLIQERIEHKDIGSKIKDILTPREQELFKLLADGHSNQEIAEKLIISIKTVQTHRAHIMEKLNLNNRTELIKYAIRQGIISVDEP